MDNQTRKYIEEHLNDDVNKLALSKFPESINKQFVIRQIQARQLLKKKLPSWSENDDLLFPRRLSLEQCSSELTAKYKFVLSQQVNETTRQQGRDASMFHAMGHIDTSNINDPTQTPICDNLCQSVVKTKTLVDLTGGMGVDTSFLSDNFENTIYVEAQEELCELARHNFKVLNKNIEVVNAKAEDFLLQCGEVDCIYLDPARRDEYGRKMVSLHDCSPDVAELQDLLLQKANTVIVKLSPMLDIDIIKKELKNIKEIHIVAVKNECKELLVVMGQQSMVNGQQNVETSLHGVSGDSDNHGVSSTAIDLRENWKFTFTEEEENEAEVSFADEIGRYLYEPGTAFMKAAPFKLLSQRFNIKKLHRNSHLYTSEELVADFPGRIFEVINVVPFDKKAKKVLSQQTTVNGQQTLSKVSIAVRNFPLSADDLRKNLGFKDGDDFYLFGTTMKGEKKVLALSRRLNR